MYKPINGKARNDNIFFSKFVYVTRMFLMKRFIRSKCHDIYHTYSITLVQEMYQKLKNFHELLTFFRIGKIFIRCLFLPL